MRTPRPRGPVGGTGAHQIRHSFVNSKRNGGVCRHASGLTLDRQPISRLVPYTGCGTGLRYLLCCKRIGRVISSAVTSYQVQQLLLWFQRQLLQLEMVVRQPPSTSHATRRTNTQAQARSRTTSR